MHEKISVVIVPGELEGVWLAVGLERYIVAQGDSLKEAIKHFMRSLLEEQIAAQDAGEAFQRRSRGVFGHIPRAPERFWEMYRDANPINVSLEELFPGEETAYKSGRDKQSLTALMTSIESLRWSRTATTPA